MIKYWSLNIENACSRKKLVVPTTDRLVQEDAKLPGSSSLIASGEQLLDVERHSSNMHLLFASGALFEHASHLNGTLAEGGKVKLEEQAPTGEPVTHIGGSGNTFLVPVWEISVR